MIPFLVVALAAAAGGYGTYKCIDGAVKMSDAKDRLKAAEKQNNKNVSRFKTRNSSTMTQMDIVGKMELEILASFTTFSNYIEKIQNRPRFAEIKIGGVTLPKYTGEELKDVSIGANVLLGASAGAGLGSLGGFAAAGATTAAVTAVGTASTGTAIASLSGVAATNAVLATLGGGTLAAGGGGVALGSTILGGATLGIGLLIGGLIFNATANSMLDKADEAWEQMLKNEKEIDKICNYLIELNKYAEIFYNSLSRAKNVYDSRLRRMRTILDDHYWYNVDWDEYHVDWKDLTNDEQHCVEDTILLVGLLYKMCQVKLVKNYESAETMNEVNIAEINQACSDCDAVLEKIAA